jgi:hypothetical protein
MNRFEYPTSKMVKEPFLLDSQSLIELDNIVNEIEEQFKKGIESEINEKVSQYKIDNSEKDYVRYENSLRGSYEYRKQSKSLRVFLKDRTMISQSFEEAIKEPANSNEIVREFKYELEVGKYELSISLNNFYSNSLNARIEPSNDLLVYDSYYKLNRWIEKNKSNKWVQIWKETRYFIIPLLLSIILLYSGISELLKPNYNVLIDNEIEKILANGIDSSETNKALELLLMKNYSKIGESYIIDKSESYGISPIIIGILIMIIILLFPPKSYLGIGKGDMLIKRWRLWLKFISVILPMSIVLPIVINKLSNIL